MVLQGDAITHTTAYRRQRSQQLSRLYDLHALYCTNETAPREPISSAGVQLIRHTLAAVRSDWATANSSPDGEG